MYFVNIQSLQDQFVHHVIHFVEASWSVGKKLWYDSLDVMLGLGDTRKGEDNSRLYE